MNVKKQILFLLALFTIIPMIAVAVICTVEFVMNSESMVKANMSDVIYLEAGSLEEFFEQQEVNLRAIGDLCRVGEMLSKHNCNVFFPDNAVERENITNLLAVQIRQQEFITTMVVADRKGTIKATTDRSLIGCQAMIPEKKTQMEQKDWVFYTDVMSDPGFHSGSPHIWITVPVYTDSEEVGFVSSAINLDYFEHKIKNMRFFENGLIGITDGKGRLIVSGGKGTSLMDLPQEAIDTFPMTCKQIDLQKSPSGFMKEKFQNVSKLSYYTSIQQTGWRVITSIGSKSPKIFTGNAQALTLLMIFGLFLLGLAADYILTKLVTLPASKIIETIHRINGGDLAARSNHRRRDELGELSISFDKMMDTIAQNISQLCNSEERYRVIAEQSEGLIFEYNIINDECYYSSNWSEKIIFQPVESGFLKHMLSCEFIHSEDLPDADVMLHALIIDGENPGRCEVRMKMTDGSYLWCSMRATAVFDKNKKPIKIIGKITNIDSRKRETEELKICAQRDMLSELYNKITVEHLIDDYLSGEGANGKHALFIIDIDNFKKINDSLGHLIGDRAIKELSAIVANVFRVSDITGRIGGDELIVLMKKFGTEQALAAKADLLVESMRHGIEDENGVEYRLSCSVGVSIFPRDGRDYTELFTKADAALYTAKANGKNQCYILRQ